MKTLAIRRFITSLASPLNRRLVLTAFIGAAAPSCSVPPTFQCGSWVFSGTPEFDSFPLSSAFTFTPSTCQSNCNVQVDAMIQMMLVYDFDSRTYLYAASADQDRADANGWTIDRINGEGEGWYGLLNDGKTFSSEWNTTGSNNTPNTPYDSPGGWPNSTFFYALDAAICFQSDTCANKILGYYFWSYTVDDNAKASKYIIAPAWQPLETEFQSAVAAWNSWAPASGTRRCSAQGYDGAAERGALPGVFELVGRPMLKVATIMKKLVAALVTSMLLSLCVAVAPRHGWAEDTSVKSVRAQLEAQQKAAAQTAQTYREKDNATLLKMLAEQSAAKKEPFNSLAFRELKGCRDVDPAALASIVRQTDNGNALLPLLLLRRLTVLMRLNRACEVRCC